MWGQIEEVKKMVPVLEAFTGHICRFRVSRHQFDNEADRFSTCLLWINNEQL